MKTEVYYERELRKLYNNNSDYLNECKASGYYYLSSIECKNLIISIGANGMLMSDAIKITNKQIKKERDILLKLIPPLRFLNNKMTLYYTAELAECLVKAATVGTGLDITIGYPELLIVKLA